MKHTDVIIGATYQVRISGSFRPVVAKRRVDVRVGSYSNDKTAPAFIVADKKTGRELPKPRKAISLRETVGARGVMSAPRAAVFASLWSDPKYVRLHARKDKLGRAWNVADARKEPQAAAAEKRFMAAIRRVQKYEDAALIKAGAS